MDSRILNTIPPRPGCPGLPYSLYSEDLATFGEDSVYDQADSAGFIHLFGLPITVQAKLKEKLAAEKE